MSKPVLSQTTSINDLVKGRPWQYQPAVLSGGPVAAWAAAGLPPGITLNATTGKLSGIPTTPGVFNVTLLARDSGAIWSDPLIFPMGVESVPFEADGAIRIDVNVQTGEVTLLDADAPLYAKAGDKILVSIGFRDGDIYIDVPMMTLVNVAMKVWDDEDFIPINDGLFVKSGDYETARYLTTLDFATDQRIRDSLEDFEDQHGTGFAGLCEINWIWFTWRSGFETPQQHERTSQNFQLVTYRDLDPTVRAPEPTF